MNEEREVSRSGPLILGNLPTTPTTPQPEPIVPPTPEPVVEFPEDEVCNTICTVGTFSVALVFYVKERAWVLECFLIIVFSLL